ncbi:MAG TPA: AAA family ATPase, partial [Leptospiraceae bacterium]|nr:AAA family ATPase [Leptospiraceae bacterium]
REFVRISLGGVRDEAEIRGHRRTYVGAMPGKILTAMKKAERRDAVFLLDEIDKTGTSYHGDPSAALLEVLDPEQNHSFEDHYLGLPYDLSRVLFVATANNADSIPLPLLDRMEIVNLSGYTLAEKRQIARKHLVPTILNDLKLDADQISFTDGAIEKVITAHTREAGVRSLKRKLEGIARKSIRKILEAREKNQSTGNEEKLTIREEDVKEMLGRDRFHRDMKEHLGKPGLAVGLAWTPVGGDILYIEAASYPGKGDFKLSGQLGDVMKESAHAAFSFLKSRAQEIGISQEAFATRDFHIHIPSGAIPKDGPSAGVTLLSALTSLLKGVPIAENIAMTGEISLRGRILPVGGIKEKVLAARAAGIETVLLPEQNRPEFEEIPAHVTEGLRVEYYSEMMELLKRTVPRAFESNTGSAGQTGYSMQASRRDEW